MKDSIFSAKTTTDEVLQGIDLTGKRILVTGISPGSGIETALVLELANLKRVRARADGLL